MKKIIAIALSLSVLSSAAFAQAAPSGSPTGGAFLAPSAAPTVVVAGGLAGGGIALALVPLLLLALLSGSSTHTTH